MIVVRWAGIMRPSWRVANIFLPHPTNILLPTFNRLALKPTLSISFHSSVENATKKSQEDKKKNATKEDEDASKENSKNGANTKSGIGTAAAAGGPLPLDAEGLPPLRKTAVNPSRRTRTQSETEEPSSNNKVLKTEDLK